MIGFQKHIFSFWIIHRSMFPQWIGLCKGLEPWCLLQNNKHLLQYTFCLPLRLSKHLSEMSLEIPPSRDLCESPVKVSCSCVYKVHSCSEFGAIPHARSTWDTSNADLSDILQVVETTCSVTFAVTHPRATLESSLHGLTVGPLTQYLYAKVPDQTSSGDLMLRPSW